MALCALLKDYLTEVTTVTVDHRLRPESSDEADSVAKTIQEIGIEKHHIFSLSWESPPQDTKKLELARDKRYDLLTRFCHEASPQYSGFLTGHHFDDLLETFFMRLAKESGVEGLCGIFPKSPSPCGSIFYKPVSAYRPLLWFKKERLIATCRSRNIRWIDDPSNHDLSRLRNRLRSDIDLVLPKTLDTHRIFDFFRHIHSHRIGMELRASEVISNYVNFDRRQGLAYVSTRHDWVDNPLVFFTVMCRLLQCVSPIEHLSKSPNQIALLHKDVFLERGGRFSHQSRPLGGAIVVPIVRYDPNMPRRVCIARVPALSGQKPVTALRVGEARLWDNRFVVALARHASELRWLSDEDKEKVAFGKRHSLPERTSQRASFASDTYFVRAFMSDDFRTLRRIRSAELHLALTRIQRDIPEMARTSIPVLETRDGKFVGLPSYDVSIEPGLICRAEFLDATDHKLHPNYIGLT